MAHEISAAVGKNSRNKSADVRTVKKLLNKIPVVYGGLSFNLDENAVVDQYVIDAIVQFQTTQFGSYDGVVNPTGRTFKRMAQVADGMVAWGSKIDSIFKAKVAVIAAKLNTCPDYLMAVMAWETGETFSPSVRNTAGSGAVGLIQFMPRTAAGLGTSNAALVQMSALDQLDYVDLYLSPFAGRVSRIDDLYVAVLLPRAVGQAGSTALFDINVNWTAYQQNSGIDTDGDGKITKAEAAAAVRGALARGLLDGNIG